MEDEKNRKRIREDIDEFFQKIEKLEDHPRIRDVAIRYARDAEHYLEKGDLMTAFGCIDYASGLIDAFIEYNGE